MLLPTHIQDLINALSRLPGVGPKTASRLTFFILNAPDEISQDLAKALENLKSETAYCQICFNITTIGQEICEVCSNPEREAGVICVVEEPLDVLALERTQGYKGRYHVLHGALSPIEGIGPEDLRIRELLGRVKTEAIQEVILATNPSMEGDATAMYLSKQLASSGVHLTRLARGLPAGGDLEYADQSTLLRALAGRQEMDS